MHSQTSTHTEHDYARIISVLSYLTIVGWLAGIVLYGSYKSSLAGFHLRQSLGLIIVAALLSFIPLIGWLLNLVVAVFWLISVVHAFKGDYYTVPLVGISFQTHLRFIA
ncbi:hypothetical protein ACFSJY_11525 [Thalassotalea euphylliae]|uniref:hypothetical protein n=1 Tax=Thalassotalea euphylliae TaxID=1655234 RepID=UPI003629E30A